MGYGQVNGHIIRRKNSSGYSYNFQITKNRKNKLSGKSEKIMIVNFGTIKDSDFSRLAVIVPFYREVVDTLKDLAEKDVINRNCVSEVTDKFAKVIPIPQVTPKKVINDEVAERLKRRFPHLFSEDEKKESLEIPLMP